MVLLFMTLKLVNENVSVLKVKFRLVLHKKQKQISTTRKSELEMSQKKSVYNVYLCIYICVFYE